MKGVGKVMIPVIIVAIAVMLYMVGAFPITGAKPQLKYSISSVSCPASCENTEIDQVSLEVKENYVYLKHTMLYPCCANFSVVLDEESLGRGVVAIKEKNVGEICRCICQYTIDVQIGPLSKGKYDIQIWGVEFQDQKPSLRWTGDVFIGNEKVCKDMCGDGVCQEIVCMAVGCPCPETPDTCPIDCKK
ncbi:MAG: hypothetical protein RMJ14_00865 [Nitrososphaerota archaeon]|nr:hypothetical protein [Nitrososphaerota archaeon]